MPRNWHVMNAATVPEIIWARTVKGKVFFYDARKPQMPIAYAWGPVPYSLCRMDGTAIMLKPLPNILACQLALRDRL